MEPLIILKSPTLKFNGVCISNPHCAVIPRGITVICGANGSGKSSLARIVESGWNYMTNEIISTAACRPRVRILAFSDIHSLSGFKTEYYQQRYESTMNEDTPTVSDLLGEKANSDLWVSMSRNMGVDSILHKRLNFLSSGELRKLLIINALFDLPDLLVLDNPYIGLDALSRPAVDEAMLRIREGGTSVMTLVSDPADITPHADAVLWMRDMTILPDSANVSGAEKETTFDKPDLDKILSLLKQKQILPGEPVVEMHGCTVKYGPHVLLPGVDWIIKSGECWALTGPNGSGKSTLLSLVNADNPQAYANDIRLFGRRRGTGESIWEIKDRIGFLSSELHLYFNGRLDTLRQVVGGGFSSFERIATDRKAEETDRWLEAFGLLDRAGQRFNTLSTGQQRLALFVRALVKQPELLILDEPMHGLDAPTKQIIRATVERLSALGTTIIFVTHCPDELPACATLKFSLQRKS